MRVEAGDQDLSEWATEWFGRHTVGIGAVTVRIYDEPRPTRQ